VPGPDGIFRISIDFDGTLVEDHVSPFRWLRGAREFLTEVTAAGIHVILHSCRATLVGYTEMPGDAEEFYRSGRVPDDVTISWALHEEMRAFLEAEGVWPLVQLWTSPGKPIADVYVDDRSQVPDWLVLAAELGVRLNHVGPRQPPPLGAAQGSPVPGPGGAGSSTAGTGAPPPASGNGLGV
jgi:hypothetical protein